uniref:Predicted protein n=1 Tax=Hordeum vulgare subsp. vulgare TaxID=112509 RepID=F2DQC0_HORVV|nr:predicted protein [Hordeum vulgare subsp. vulgare]
MSYLGGSIWFPSSTGERLWMASRRVVPTPWWRVLQGARLEGWVASMRSRHLSPARGVLVRIHPLPFLPVPLLRAGYEVLPAELLRVDLSAEGRQLVQSQGLCVGLGLSSCRATALAAGGATFVGGACVSRAGGQPGPREWHGCRWLAELGWDGGV